MDNTLRFWGVRGSLPSPGPRTASVGGNTSCVELRLAGERIIIDGGTGLRVLGMAEAGEPFEATLLFTHMHWDHIQGVPFFAPLYQPQNKITIIGPQGLKEALIHQMSTPMFPVGMEAFGADINFVSISPGDRFAIGDLDIETILLDHPGGAIGYRFCWGALVVVSIFDCELGDGEPSDKILDFVRNAELIIGDAQYTPEEYLGKKGWGHSTYEHMVKIAIGVAARRLILTHHEPTRSDGDIAALELNAQRLFPHTNITREDEIILLGDVGGRPVGDVDTGHSTRAASVVSGR